MRDPGMTSHVLFWKLRGSNHYFLRYGIQEEKLLCEGKNETSALDKCEFQVPVGRH